MLVLVLAGTSKAGIMFGPGKEHMAEHGAALAQKVRESQMVLHVDEVCSPPSLNAGSLQALYNTPEDYPLISDARTICKGSADRMTSGRTIPSHGTSMHLLLLAR